MIGRITKITLACAVAGLSLSGCATTESVERAQSTADQALASANSAGSAASHAQSTADAAGVARQQAARADFLGMQPWQSNEVAGLLFAVRARSVMAHTPVAR